MALEHFPYSYDAYRIVVSYRISRHPGTFNNNLPVRLRRCLDRFFALVDLSDDALGGAAAFLVEVVALDDDAAVGVWVVDTLDLELEG